MAFRMHARLKVIRVVRLEGEDTVICTQVNDSSPFPKPVISGDVTMKLSGPGFNGVLGKVDPGRELDLDFTVDN